MTGFLTPRPNKKNMMFAKKLSYLNLEALQLGYVSVLNNVKKSAFV